MLRQPAPFLATRVHALHRFQGKSPAPPYRFFCSSSASNATPWIRHSGECALLLRFGTDIDMEVNKKMLAYLAVLDKLPPLDGLVELLPTYASLFVKFDPLKVSSSEVEKWCLSASSSTSSGSEVVDEPRQISIPVCYGGEYGPDIAEAAEIAGLSSAEEVVRVHSNGDYRVYFLGFMGGFPYMGGLPAVLAKVPRLQTPRQKVPKGTVGIAGGQTGVYTIDTPGGWYMLGRTPENLFDPSKDPPSLLRAGDLVKFVPSEDSAMQKTGLTKALSPPERPWIQILSPGPLTTVQDFGRSGYARYGVSYSGAADKLALRMGNVLLGNEAGAAGLEVMMGGLKFRCLDACAIALTGADCEAKLKRRGQGRSQELRMNEALLLQCDDEVDLSFPKDGMRTYVCVQGGVDVPIVLGSRSTDIRGGLGGLQGRSLERNDTIGRLSREGAEPLQPALVRAAHDPLRSVNAASGKTWRLRVLPGPGDPRTGEVFVKELQALLDARFNVSSRADRMAVCVAQEGKDEANAAAKQVEKYRDIPYGISEYVPPELIMGKWMNFGSLVGGQQLSEGSISGTVQLPPDGNPVILLAEHQTTGGYKVPAVVIQADLWQVGQMKPGDKLSFVPTSPEEAVSALRQLHAHAHETKNL